MFVWGILFLDMVTILGFLIGFNGGRPSFIKAYKNELLVYGFCVLFLVMGIMRVQISEFTVVHASLSKLNDAPGAITFIGTVTAEPDIRDTNQKLRVRVGDSLVLVTLGRYPEYHYLDTIQITGKLKTPVIFNTFNYKNYVMKDGIYSVMDFPKAELVSSKHHYNLLTFSYEKILWLKSILMQSIDMNFSPPHNTILQGVVFGNDKNMAKNIKDKFNTTGLSHLTAVSGSNIVIVISVVMFFLLGLGLWRGQAFYVAVIFIWLYIVMIGFPASGARAGIMGCIALLAQKLGRQHASSRVLILAASLMLLQNPFLLPYDVSFQLSFLASLGIMYVKPFIDMLFQIIVKDTFKSVIDIISITFSAQVSTLPIIIYNFGSVSLVSPITNLLVLPMIPLLTVLGFLVSVVGAVSSILGFVLSLPCWFLLLYLVKILDIFSQPWASKTIPNFSWIWLAVYYLILLVSLTLLQKYQKPRFLGY